MLAYICEAIICATFGVFLTSLLGAILKYKQILNSEHLKNMSKMVEDVIYPCLIFTGFVKSFRFYEFLDWTPVMLLSFLNIIIGKRRGPLNIMM